MSRKKVLIFAIPITLILCFIGAFSKYRYAKSKVLDRVELLLQQDSVKRAKEILDDFRENNRFYPKQIVMRSDLLYAEWMERTGKTFEDDSALIKLVEYYSRMGDRREKTKVRFLLGSCYYSMHLYVPARLWLTAAAQCAMANPKGVDDVWGVKSCEKLSEICKLRKQYIALLTVGEQTGEFAQRLNNRPAMTRSKMDIANAHLNLKQYDEACRLYGKILSSCKAGRDDELVIKCYMDMAVSFAHQNKRARAESCMAKFQELYQKLMKNNLMKPTIMSDYYSYKVSLFAILNEEDSLKQYFLEAKKYNIPLTDRSYKGFASSFFAKGKRDTEYALMDEYIVQREIERDKAEQTALSVYKQFFDKLMQRKRAEVENAEVMKRIYIIAALLILFIISFLLYRIYKSREYKRLMEYYTLKCEEIRRQRQLLRTLQNKVDTTKVENELGQMIEEQSLEISKNLKKEEVARLRYAQIQAFVSFHTIHSKKMLRQKISKEDYNQFMEELIVVSPAAYNILTGNLLSEPMTKICILVMMKMSTKEIAEIMCCESHTVSTDKQRLNNRLFGENTAKGLEINLLSLE